MWQPCDEKNPYGIRLKQSLFDSSCVRLCVKMPGFHGRKREENTFSVNLDKKRTHQAFLLGEFVAKEANCDTRDG
jgi:hypothetical protein